MRAAGSLDYSSIMLRMSFHGDAYIKLPFHVVLIKVQSNKYVAIYLICSKSPRENLILTIDKVTKVC